MTLFDASKKAVRDINDPAMARVLSKPKWVEREADELTQSIFDEKTLDEIDFDSHHEERHVSQSITSMIERCISNDMRNRVDATSEFYNPEAVRTELEDAILDNAEDIVRWRADPQGKEKQVFLTEPKDEPVGHGVRYWMGSLEHAEANQTAIVLAIDRKNPHGFRLVTMYPYIKTNDATPTGMDITKQLHEAPSYQSASEKRKERLDRAAAIEPPAPNRTEQAERLMDRLVKEKQEDTGPHYGPNG